MLLLDTSIFTLALNYLHCFYGIFCHHSIFNNLLATKLFPVQFLILQHGFQYKVLKADTNGWNFGPISPAGRIIMPWRNFRTSHKYRSNPNHTLSPGFYLQRGADGRNPVVMLLPRHSQRKGEQHLATPQPRVPNILPKSPSEGGIFCLVRGCNAQRMLAFWSHLLAKVILSRYIRKKQPKLQKTHLCKWTSNEISTRSFWSHP